MRKTLLGLSLLCASSTAAIAAPTFNFQYIAGTSADAQAGFQAAAAAWASVLTDNVTINMTVGVNPLQPGILGQTGSAMTNYSYSAVKTALTNDAKSANDAIAVAHLPAGNSVNMLLNRTSNSPNGSGSAVPYIDNNNNANNNTVRMTNAEAKALGLNPNAQVLAGCIGTCDAFIQFNSNYNFDFNRSNGILSNAFDFVGIAMHEIGHALGFISGVDVLDFNSPPSGGSFLDSQFTFLSPLDLFRYSALSKQNGVIDWTADQRAKFFSIDGGATQGGCFATGVYKGDGRQASHWCDNQNVGIMDPTAGLGELLNLSANDLRAFDVIGWDLAGQNVPVPEPSSIALLGLGLLGLTWGRKKLQA